MAALEVGDLVVLSRPHCAEVAKYRAGNISKIVAIGAYGDGRCGSCGGACDKTSAMLEGWFGIWTLNQFERIPPLSESELLSDKHDIPVPAEIRGLKRITKEPA